MPLVTPWDCAILWATQIKHVEMSKAGSSFRLVVRVMELQGLYYLVRHLQQREDLKIYCETHKLQTMIGAKIVAYHIMCSSLNSNRWGGYLHEFVVKHNLEVHKSIESSLVIGQRDVWLLFTFLWSVEHLHLSVSCY